jgi:hypothetical protein
MLASHDFYNAANLKPMSAMVLYNITIAFITVMQEVPYSKQIDHCMPVHSLLLKYYNSSFDTIARTEKIPSSSL